MNKYDLTILGAGPGGYVAALYAAQLGLRVCLIEEDKIGGVCLNSGCIPTKALVASAKALSCIRNSENLGINAENVTFDFQIIAKRKKEIVEKLKNGVESLLKSRGVITKRDKGILVDKDAIKIDKETIRSKYIIIATGSNALGITCAEFDGKSVLSSREALQLDSVPKELVIIGGGAIGCEFASIFSELGAHVTIIEMLEHLIPAGDTEISKRLEVALKKKNIGVMTGVKTEYVRVKGPGGGVIVKVSNGREIPCDKILISVGRKPNVSNIGLESLGIKFDKEGIKVDQTLKTNIDNIYAIGDCIGGYMYAHVASYEAVIACNNIAGRKEAVDYSAVPYCIFTNPDIASSGMNENLAKTKGLDVSVSKFYFRALGKAHTLGETDGFIKLVTDRKTGKILGADIMGEAASELIAEATLAIKKGLTPEDLVQTIHAHPTMSEAILEVAHVAEGKPIHTL